jgi:hypothetical protein
LSQTDQVASVWGDTYGDGVLLGSGEFDKGQDFGSLYLLAACLHARRISPFFAKTACLILAATMQCREQTESWHQCGGVVSAAKAVQMDRHMHVLHACTFLDLMVTWSQYINIEVTKLMDLTHMQSRLSMALSQLSA